MPTGYTANMLEKKQTFTQFAMSCARAMGVCIMQRDDGMGDKTDLNPIPSQYHKEALDEAIKKEADLTAMTEQQIEAYGAEQIKEDIKTHEEINKKDTDENAGLTKMRVKVQEWEAPSEDHDGLKDFMLNQLLVSLNDGAYRKKKIEAIRLETPQERHEADLIQAGRDIAHHAKEWREENHRTRKHANWIQSLVNSLPEEYK